MAVASNSFGERFRMTTWGESHGKAVGVVIDGCPAGLSLSEKEINEKLAARAPGNSPYTSPRKEPDQAEILSGVFEGVTTGAPISIIIPNRDADSSKYEATKNLLRPGHANYPYLQKYGVFDYRGGGRASGRETVARVAAAAVAQKLLDKKGITVRALLDQIGSIRAEQLLQKKEESTLGCLDSEAEKKMVALLEKTQKEGDSIGGIVALEIDRVPVGLGEPVYQKLDATLAFAMMSIPAVKGVEIGSGFSAAEKFGSQNNDSWTIKNGEIATITNHAGGILGGLSNGEKIILRVVFKPTSSIKKEQETVTLEGEESIFFLPEGSRHDPCIAIRGASVVEAMATLVIADFLLLSSIF